MGKIIALANQKGGVGKTTSTVNLAYALVQQGQRVLVVDVDPQSSLTIYCGHDPRVLEQQQRTVYWALMKEKELGEIVIPGNPAVVASSIHLASAEPELVTLWDSATVLRDKLSGIKNDYNFILIDCPPSLTLLTVNCWKPSRSCKSAPTPGSRCSGYCLRCLIAATPMIMTA